MFRFQHVLSTNSKYERGKFPGAEDLFLGVGENGLIVANGEVHKKLRKLASPAFKLSNIKKVMPIIELCGERMIKLFRKLCDEHSLDNKENTNEVDIKELLSKTTLDVIGLMAFGHDFEESCSFKTDTFGCKLRKWLNIKISMFCLLPFQLPIKFFIAMKLMRYIPKNILKDHHTTYEIHDLVDSIVQKKIDQKSNGVQSDNVSGKTLLDSILNSQESAGATQKEIHDLLMTFLIAGHETSALALTWTLYLLAKYPRYQEKCREEGKTFFAQQKTIEWDDVKKLSFHNAVVHEALRLYSPIPWLSREPTAWDKVAGCYIPPYTDTLVILCEMHRNPEYWSNPLEFLPERFLEPHDSIPWDAFMPFGDGPHKCIGYQLALVEIVYFLALLMKNFSFSANPNIEYKDFCIITMQPRPKLKLYVKPV